MLSVSDKYDSVSERTQEISELMKLHIQEAWQSAHKFITQLAHYYIQCSSFASQLLSLSSSSSLSPALLPGDSDDDDDNDNNCDANDEHCM